MRSWGPQAWLRAALLLGGLFALAHALGLGDAGRAFGSIPELCVFHRVTGLQCPGCGMTRAFVCLLQGDARGAWAYNPLSLPFFALLLVLAALPQERLRRWSLSAWATAAGWAALAGVLAWWALTRSPWKG